MPTFTKGQIKEIADQLDCGFRAFYHKQTREFIFVPDTDKHMDWDVEAWQDDLDKVEENFMNYHQINGMETTDAFQVMADFAEQQNDKKLQEKLINALNKRKPFKEFKFIIDNAGEQRENWFDFKNKRYIEWTEEQLKMQNDIDQEENDSN